MKVVAVLGSPNENGNSSTLVKEILRGAADAGNETVVYDINKMNVTGCQGCGYCRENSVNCKIDDDMKAYWKNLEECGALILSSPNYYSQICGPMITFMNRHYCLSDKNHASRLHKGIKLIGVFSQGNTDAEAYKDRYNWYLNVFAKHNMMLSDVIIHTGAPVQKDSELMKRAYNDGKAL